MHPMVNIAIRAARKAGKVITDHLEKFERIKVETKANHDYVTEVDKLAEQVITDVIHQAYPAHSILAEESGQAGFNKYTWIIDPLDGTTNYIHRLPHFAVSIAVQYQDKITHAVIYDPIRQDLFTASYGQGATLNNKKIRTSKCTNFDNALIATGFPYTNPKQLANYLKTFSAIFPHVAGIRRCGSAALDLAYVAAGFFDGFWESNLQKWDIAAGALLIKEAGGFVSDFAGEENYLATGDLIAGNPKIFKALSKIIIS